MNALLSAIKRSSRFPQLHSVHSCAHIRERCAAKQKAQQTNSTAASIESNNSNNNTSTTDAQGIASDTATANTDTTSDSGNDTFLLYRYRSCVFGDQYVLMIIISGTDRVTMTI